MNKQSKKLTILLITGNQRKVWQATETLKPYGITVLTKELDVVEIQDHDPVTISIAKAKAAYDIIKKPLVVCDHSWSIPALKGFPGGYMKDVNSWFEAGDWLALMKDKKDPTTILTETVIYIDKKELQYFSSTFNATIINEARGIGKNGGEQVTVFDGYTETIAERIDAGEHARDMLESAWDKFGNWYKTR